MPKSAYAARCLETCGEDCGAFGFNEDAGGEETTTSARA
jgi:hypothetical protein